MLTLCLYIMLASSPTLVECLPTKGESIFYDPVNVSFDFVGDRYYADKDHPELTFTDYSEYPKVTTHVLWDTDVVFRDSFGS